VCIIIVCKIGGDDGVQLPVLLQLHIRTVQLAVDEEGNDARHRRDVIVDEDGWLRMVNPAWCSLHVREC
jgi:hypothetical protein